MGGPWIGKVYWKDHLLPGDYLMQPIVMDGQLAHAVLVCTNQRSAIARSQVSFQLTVVHLRDGTVQHSRTVWPALYVEEMDEDLISFYIAFHPGKPVEKHYLHFQAEEFSPKA